MKSFFISGVQRSGTTLLSTMLGKHKEVYTDGYAIAFRLITCLKNYEMVLPDNLQHSKEDILSWLIKNDYKGRLADLLDYQNLDQYPNVRALIRQSIQQRLDQHGKKIWGDKVPNIQYFIPDLLTYLPETKIIHIIRDGRATANSLSRRAYKNLYLGAQEWVDGNIVALAHHDLLGQEQFLVIHYEQLLQDPETILKKICQFLEVDFDPNMLNLEEGRSAEAESKHYVKSKLDSSKINQYKTQLSAKQLKKIERIQGPLLQKLGYPLDFDHRKKDFKQLSILRRIWLNQKDNIGDLFRAKKQGMNNRMNVEVKVPFIKRAHRFLQKLSYDIFSLRIHKTLFRRSFVKGRFVQKD